MVVEPVGQIGMRLVMQIRLSGLGIFSVQAGCTRWRCVDSLWRGHEVIFSSDDRVALMASASTCDSRIRVNGGARRHNSTPATVLRHALSPRARLRQIEAVWHHRRPDRCNRSRPS